MPTITWNHLCNFCHRPIPRDKPTILFATDKPLLLGISRSTCGATKYKYGHHQMIPPAHLSCEQVSFLIQYFPMLYSLPSGFESNSDLRRCAANFHWDYPDILAYPLKCVHDFQEQNQDEPRKYEGDLEADYLKFLGNVQKAAKENPVDVKFEFQ
jgi:hypothetical protein